MIDADGPISDSRWLDPFDPAVHPELYDEILAKRVVAFVIDVLIVVIAMVPALLVVLILGLLTLGLGFALFPFVFAIIALGYLALTLGAEASATIGMRAAGIEVRTVGGARMSPVLAALHGLMFWLSVGFLTPLVLLVGLLSDRKRLLHDLVLGTVVLNAAELWQLERRR